VRHSGLREAIKDGTWVSQKLADGRTYAVELGGETGGARVHFMPDAAKIGTSSPSTMMTLPSLTAYHTAFHAAERRDVPMLRFHGPGLAGHGGALAHRHASIIGRPVFRVTVWGVNPKHLDRARACTMDVRTRMPDRTVSHLAIAGSVRMYEAVGFYPREPEPSKFLEEFHVCYTAVPPVKTDLCWPEPAFMGHVEQRTNMVVLRLSIVWAIKQAIILLCIGRIQGGVINHQNPSCPIHERFCLAPPWQGIWFQPMEQPRARIMRGLLWPLRLNPCTFGTRNDTWCGEQDVAIVEIGHLGLVHRRIVPQVEPTA